MAVLASNRGIALVAAAATAIALVSHRSRLADGFVPPAPMTTEALGRGRMSSPRSDAGGMDSSFAVTRMSARRGGGGRTVGGRVLRPPPGGMPSSSSPSKAKKKGGGGVGIKKKQPLTLEQLANKISSDPAAAAALTGGQMKKKKASRTRRRVDRPKQTYVYASQRRRMERDGDGGGGGGGGGSPSRSALDGAEEIEGEIDAGGAGTADGGGDEISPSSSPPRQRTYRSLDFARSLGLVPSTQSCFPVTGQFEGSEPSVVGEVRVEDFDDEYDEEEEGAGAGAGGGRTTGMYAYVIDKPAGWSILGDGKKGKRKKKSAGSASSTSSSSLQSQSQSQSGGRSSAPGNITLDFYDDTADLRGVQDGDETLEFRESDLLAMMTPEERAEFEAEGGLDGLDLEMATPRPAYASSPSAAGASPSSRAGAAEAKGETSPSSAAFAEGGDRRRRRISGYDEDGEEGTIDFDEADFLASLTPEERAEFESEGGFDSLLGIAPAGGGGKGKGRGKGSGGKDGGGGAGDKAKAEESGSGAAARDGEEEVFEPQTRPSVVSWLKSLKAAEGTPIRGGKYWRAVAGATEVDDSGLVVLCPKDRTDALHVDYATYVAAVGNGGKVAPRSSKRRNAGRGGQMIVPYAAEEVEADVVARLRRHRGDDPVTVVALSVPDGASNCNEASLLCQSEYDDGIRGDPAADPLERRAPRRLVHCGAMSVSSLVCDDDVEVMTDPLPDDIANLAERRDGQEYARGSFLGRQSELLNDELTNCYREINGAADGHPGWIVDRYDKWLLVQHDPSHPRGPLPSIHDGNTAGVYYYPTDPDRSTISDVKPALMEGRAAPDEFPVLESGITYRVRLGESFSTGLFLDQRPQRAWLARHCTPKTRVLNCFAHCGAFSVAAATAGASTVSLDLDRKWLDRIRPQMEDNGIEEWEGKHDCIYGDCFDWLARLGKRGEKYDIVILDPPSTSVGGRKKKRWSLRNDMDELVSLAAPLVRSGGLLWTTTNAAGVSAEKFARMCRRGLEGAGADRARLERVAPMPGDFPCVGPPPVKNLVWRVP